MRELAANMTTNKQDGNVGNRGDVIKHRVLVDLLYLLASKLPDAQLVYVDTHAYAFDAVLPNGRAQTIRPRSESDLYFQFEQPYLDKGEYLCSPGIAAALSKGFPRSSLLVSELLPVYLERLRSSFGATFQGGDAEVVFSDKFSQSSFSEALSKAANPVVYMLIDPFSYKQDRDSVNLPLHAASIHGAPTLVQLFNYGEALPNDVTPVGWYSIDCNEPPYYNRILINALAADLLDLECVAGLVRAAL